jgi:hypothetical protein
MCASGEHDAYDRAEAFVAATNLRYGLTSDKLTELGGSELARLPELYGNDFDWASQGYIITARPTDRVEIELLDGECPLAVANFLSLCKGDKGKSKASGCRLHYKGNHHKHSDEPNDPTQRSDSSRY